MKLTEVIKQLNKIYKDKGNLDVCVSTGATAYDVSYIEAYVYSKNTSAETTVVEIE